MEELKENPRARSAHLRWVSAEERFSNEALNCSFLFLTLVMGFILFKVKYQVIEIEQSWRKHSNR